MIKKGIKFAVLTLLCYLLESTVASNIAILNVAPNIALAIAAAVSVGLGRKYTFVLSVTVGYLLEIMMPPLNYFYLILYPVCAMLGALVFSDKSERRLEEERTRGKRATNLPPHTRTVLCAVISSAIFETVNLLYIYLNGVQLDGGHYQRALISVIYTTALAGLLQFPVRWWMDIYKLKKAR